MATDKSFKRFDVERIPVDGKFVPMQSSRKVLKSVVYLPTHVTRCRNIVKGGTRHGGRGREREQRVNILGIDSAKER